MPTIHLKRDSGWADRVRAYKVLLDGEVIGEIRNGAQASFDVPAGSHELSLKIDWCETSPVQFNTESGSVSFSCGSSLRGWRIFLAIIYVTARRDQYIWLKRDDEQRS